MGLKDALAVKHGRDDAKIFLNKQAVVDSDEITYMRAHGVDPGWVAAVSDRYKLVLSKQDVPWLFDLEKDPDELTNYYTYPEYQAISELLSRQLALLMETAKDPLLKEDDISKWLLLPDH